MDYEKKLTAYIRAELVRERPDDAPLHGFFLFHAPAGKQGRAVDHWLVAGEALSLEREDDSRLAAEILDRAQTDADGHAGSGPQRYRVEAQVRGDTRNPTRFVVTLRPQEDEDELEGGDEPANARGLVAQSMRHTEVAMRIATQGLHAAMSQMSRMCEQLGRENESMRTERAEMFKTLEAAKSQESERELLAMTAMKEQERKDALIQKAVELAPVVVNRLTDGKVKLPGGEVDPLEKLLESLAISMTQEQFASIASSLNMEQKIQFAEVMRTITERRKQRAPTNGNNGTH